VNKAVTVDFDNAVVGLDSPVSVN